MICPSHCYVHSLTLVASTSWSRMNFIHSLALAATSHAGTQAASELGPYFGPTGRCHHSTIPRRR
jgi:hypothetical protein